MRHKPWVDDTKRAVAPPILLRLISEGLVRQPTADVLMARLDPPAGPNWLDESTFAILAILCERLRPFTPRPTGRELACLIDARLAEDKADGWRYDAMPPDREAYRLGLQNFAAEAETRHSKPLAKLDGETVDEMILALQRGETQTDWGIPPTRFLEDLLAEVAGLAYAHPDAQSAMGYIGYADARGWKHVGPNEREEWEL